MEISQNIHDSAVVVAVTGDIDSAAVDQLVKKLDAALKVASDHSQKLLVVDLGEVTYFGSAGLNALLGCYESGVADGVGVRVVASTAEVMRPLQVTQFDAVFRPYPSVPDALAGRTDDGS